MWTTQYLTSTLLLWPAVFFQLSSAATITPRNLQPFVWNAAGGFTMPADSGCSDKNPANPKETKYDFLWRGFAGASEISQVAWDRFSKHTYPELKKGAPDLKKQQEIDDKDPAYTQLFAMDWSSEGLEKIHGILQKMQAFNSDPGKDGRPKDGSEIEVSCKSKYVVDGTDWCNRGKGDETLAWLHNEEDENGNKQKSILNLCDKFFDLPDFDTWKKASEATYKEDTFTNDDWYAVRYLPYYNDGTQAMTLFHELTHVWWIGPTNPVYGDSKSSYQDPPENYGVYLTGKEASKCQHNNKNCNQNADSYSIYAEVGYFQGKYAGSLWPADGPYKKHVQLPVSQGKSQHTG